MYAHREQRRAEAFRRGGRLEEAAECHSRAAELLLAALTLTPTPLARQSITLQHSYHLRQQELLKFRSKQLEKYVKAMENQRVKMGTASGSSGGGVGPGGRELTPPGPYTAKRPQAITQEVSKYAEKFDSLLSLLILEDEEELDTKEEAEGDKSTPTEEAETKAGAKENSKISGELAGKAKMPANEKAEEAGSSIGEVQSQKKKKNILVIVEELRTLRDHQADLISQLMTELSHMERENCQLKSQVRELQNKCEQYEGERRRMRALADSSCSPFVFSPLSEISPDPPSVDLAPLEMPPLDFMENFEKDS
ncbi:putative nuclear receptor-binding factor 2-like isoform X1 [Penaeus vannamei]|uniref:Putative nuclear receptor-binding factor 2-like isoform X1 n=1 Tax=Penaeus vannamei TaxID=6689 RepID=A0A3R7Q4B5_PENVA|nr:putative nuclear receptor-binding factor 2-like isoform X1 [Penaeus vannamei]